MVKLHRCPNCDGTTYVDFDINRRKCLRCEWVGDLIEGGKTSQSHGYKKAINALKQLKRYSP